MIHVPGQSSRDITEHVGELLYAGRAADGVPAQLMIGHLLIGTHVELDAVEKNPRPGNAHIEEYSLNVRVNFRRNSARRIRPLAARNQLWAGPLDTILTLYARHNRPSASWWWGKRRHDAHDGPWCYLCLAYICPPQLTLGMDDRWAWPIMEHRGEHLTQYKNKAPITVLVGVYHA